MEKTLQVLNALEHDWVVRRYAIGSAGFSEPMGGGPSLIFSLGVFLEFRSSCFVPGLVTRNRDTHVLSELITVYGDLTHPLENPGVMVPFPALVTHPSRNVLDDNQRFPMPEVFTSPLRFQVALAAERADLTGHI